MSSDDSFHWGHPAGIYQKVLESLLSEWHIFMVCYGPLHSPAWLRVSFVLFLDQKEHFYSFSEYM